jgi:hypothetical protein
LVDGLGWVGNGSRAEQSKEGRGNHQVEFPSFKLLSVEKKKMIARISVFPSFANKTKGEKVRKTPRLSDRCIIEIYRLCRC